jgi:hypothetical protein
VRVRSIRPVVVGIALAATALLSACSSQNGADASSGTSLPTVAASPENQAQQQVQSVGGQAADDQVEDVNCSTNGGKVGPAGGAQVDLIAVGTKTGRVGCTEAFTVITEYYRDAPTKSEGTAHVLVVQGWRCMADTGAQGTGMIGCDKDGLAFHTGQ